MLKKGTYVAAAMLLTTGAAWAQPEIVSLGSGGPNSVTPSISGTYYIGGSGISSAAASRWTLTGTTLTGSELGGTGGGLVSANGAFATATVLNNNPQISGNMASGITPPFNPNPKLIPVPLAVTEGCGAHWDASTSMFQNMGGLPIVPELMVYGSGSSGGSTGNFISPNAISQNGRFVVGLGYISTFNNSSGTTITANTFQWRPWIWDSEANDGAGAYTVLPTPFRTSTNTWRRRTGNAYAVSNDGLVIVGAQEHNVGTLPAADPDGGRPVVWRWNAETSEYVMTYLPNGVNESGFPYTLSSTPGTYFINAAGTLIVGKAVDNTGSAYIAKWIWDESTSTWNSPLNLGSGLAAPATWLPDAVISCGLPPTLTPTGMSDDGNTVVGMAVYSTCGSFMSGGFIWTSDLGTISDWYDTMSESVGATIFENYGPIGDNGDPNRGLPRLGFPTSISTDGNAIVGLQGGTQRIPGAAPWIILMSGGPGCVPPVLTLNPAATFNLSACTSSIILNAAAAGTLPITYQWQKDGVDLLDGMNASGSIVTGATSFQLRVNQLLSPSDVGAYHAVLTGPCGKPLSSSTSTVQLDPAYPAPANDTCAGAEVVAAGVNVLNPAQSVCGALLNDPLAAASCAAMGSKADRWYVFTPATDGNYRLETCGATFDTILSVFSGCEGSEIACNDNYDSGPSAGCNANRSRISSVQLTAGLPYYIRIAAPLTAFLSDFSTMNLSIIGAPTPPANDFCSTATPAVIGVNNFDTNEATSDMVVTCNSATLARDVFFTFTPTTNGTLRLTTCGTAWNTVLTALSDCFGTELACNDDSGVSGCSNQSIIEDLAIQANTTVYIRVGSSSNTNSGGPGILTVEFEAECLADFNADDVVNSQDFFDFLNAFFNLDPNADFNGDMVVNSQDFFDFLNTFFIGC